MFKTFLNDLEGGVCVCTERDEERERKGERLCDKKLVTGESR